MSQHKPNRVIRRIRKVLSEKCGRKIHQDEFGELIGKSRATVQRYEYGAPSRLEREIRMKLRPLLDDAIEYLREQGREQEAERLIDEARDWGI